MNRLSLNLTEARKNFFIPTRKWHYLFIGKCNGDVSIKLDSRSASELDPNEFDKLTGIEEVRKIYVTNEAQVEGKVLNIYFEEEQVSSKGIKVKGVT